MADYLAVLLPSIGVGLVFWFVMRSVMRADRGEREAEKAARTDAQRWYEGVRAREGHRIAVDDDDAPQTTATRRDGGSTTDDEK